jgi:hypothetical protein
MGHTGLRGHTGLQGFQGFTGLQGARGDPGERGHTGLQGFQGPTGTLNFDTIIMAAVGITGQTASFINLETTNDTFLAIGQDRNVGIGTKNPTTKLDVNGILRTAQGITGPTGSFTNLHTTNDTYLAVNQGMNVGIGKINPLFKLDVSGAAFISGNLTALTTTTTSDYRIKKDIKFLDDKFSTDNLNPVIYKLKNTDQTQTGFIAHEIQEYYPFLVNGEKDGETMQSINYFGIIPILVKEIQELKKEKIKASLNENTADKYDSNWVAIERNSSYIFTHNLNWKMPDIPLIKILFSNVSEPILGTDMIFDMSYRSESNNLYGISIRHICSNTIVIGSCIDGVYFCKTGDNIYDYKSGYIRVIMYR